MILEHKKGFTLIEMLIVVAIIGILVAIALPAYGNYKIRMNRLDAQSEMSQIAQKLASYKLANNDYSKTSTVNGVSTTSGVSVADNYIYGSTSTPKQGTAQYTLSLTNPNPYNGWTLTATPTGRQTGNGAITLTDTGAQCWYKGKDTFIVGTDTCYKWTDR